MPLPLIPNPLDPRLMLLRRVSYDAPSRQGWIFGLFLEGVDTRVFVRGGFGVCKKPLQAERDRVHLRTEEVRPCEGDGFCLHLKK